jgi:hypothetical protein
MSTVLHDALNTQPVQGVLHVADGSSTARISQIVTVLTQQSTTAIWTKRTADVPPLLQAASA